MKFTSLFALACAAAIMASPVLAAPAPAAAPAGRAITAEQAKTLCEYRWNNKERLADAHKRCLNSRRAKNRGAQVCDRFANPEMAKKAMASCMTRHSAGKAMNKADERDLQKAAAKK